MRRESCVLSRKWHLSILCFVTPGTRPGQSRWLRAPLRPGHSRHPALLGTVSISLSLTWDRVASSSVRARLPGERTTRGRAAPRRLESGVTSFQVSSQSLPASGAAGEYCVGQESRRVLCFKMSEFCDFLCDTLLVFSKMIAATQELMKSVKKECCSVNLLWCDLKVQV